MVLKAKPVVALNRSRKSQMIRAFLADALRTEPTALRVLDIGCGNGDICASFAKENVAIGVDVQDQVRSEHKLLSRCLARSEALPFGNDVFDVVLSHHVIEHVNSHEGHLSEIRRVLRPDGVCYLGTPNRSSPLMRGHVGNPMVLEYHQMAPLFRRMGFSVEECYERMLKLPDRYHCETRLARFSPVWLLRMSRRWYPSQCFLLRRSA